MKIFKSKKSILIITISIILVVVLSFFLKEFFSNYIVRLNMNTTKAPEKGSRVLVFSPHNDDEVLGAGEFIKAALKNGCQVKVILMTNGDGFKQAIQFDYFNLNPKPKDYIKFGYTRQKESINALKILGLPKQDIIFLGYPDGGMSALWSTYWDRSSLYISRSTQDNRSPYTNSFTKGIKYCGENVEQDVIKIIEDYKPTVIVYPHPNDRHPDHWATNAFVKYALTYLDYKPMKEWLYLVHRGDWPTPMKKETRMYLVPPAKLIGTGTKWYAFNLSSTDILEKSEAIHTYKTQIKTLGPLLAGFERKNELLGIYSNFKLPQSKNNNEIIPNESNQVIIDPLNDTLNLALSKGSDLSGVYIERNANGNIDVAIKANDEIEKTTKYNLNLMFFQGKNISKLNLEIENGKIHSKNVSRQSITNTEEIKINVKKDFIFINIPEKIAGNFNNIFINAYTSTEDKMMDKTAWRMIDK